MQALDLGLDIAPTTDAAVTQPEILVKQPLHGDTQDVTVGASMTIQDDSSVHFASQPVIYVPKTQNKTQYGNDQNHV